MSNILIFSDPRQARGRGPNYYLRYMIQYWENAGHQISFTSRTKNNPPADIAIVHFDATVVPEEILEEANRYPVVINGCCRSINKELFSKLALEANSSYKGKVIVKTKRNSGGLPELQLEADPSKRERQEMLDTFRTLDPRESKINARMVNLYWRNTSTLPRRGYPVFDNLSTVPEGVWSNPALFVEKFVPEFDHDGNYLMRCWNFFGGRHVNEVNISRLPVVRSNVNKRNRDSYIRNFMDPDVQNMKIPDELHAVRNRLGLDWGSIDWVIQDGRAIVIDASRTPVNNDVPDTTPEEEDYIDSLDEYLALALNEYLHEN